MHPNSIFRKTDSQTALAFAQARGFGTLGINGSDGPLAAHIPFILSDDGSKAMFHMLRSNPIARMGNDAKALLVVNGPDAYISPDWYGVEQQVPTWNYIAVHLRGSLKILPSEALKPHLRALSSHFEQQLLPKPVWLLDKVSSENQAKMTRMIIPAELEITKIDSTWKLGQNKPDKARILAAKVLETSPLGMMQTELAQWMCDADKGN
ncbi:MAG: FMN-binding negative transcriptional regulator [Rhodobacteraceae bacterium]|nr:FMN-binding negative transcriptional regulator [Paracoccaceae bacterium]